MVTIAVMKDRPRVKKKKTAKQKNSEKQEHRRKLAEDPTYRKAAAAKLKQKPKKSAISKGTSAKKTALSKVTKAKISDNKVPTRLRSATTNLISLTAKLKESRTKTGGKASLTEAGKKVRAEYIAAKKAAKKKKKTTLGK